MGWDKERSVERNGDRASWGIAREGTQTGAGTGRVGGWPEPGRTRGEWGLVQAQGSERQRHDTICQNLWHQI